MNKAAAAMALLLGLWLGAAARPAPWYLWQCRLDGKTVCFQTSPGEGWVRVDGPFSDARCGKPA
jgi:hypothetical protein